MGSMKTRISFVFVVIAVTFCILLPAASLAAQNAPASNRLVGSITAIDGKSITIKPDSGTPSTVTVSDTARLLRTAPGAKSLAGASPIQFSDLAIGDRVLVAITPSADNSAPPTATTIIAMKQADIAQKQQADQADWQRRGIGGIVKSIDTASGVITITAGTRTFTIHATPQTTVRHYAPDSIKFSDAQPSTLGQIHPGDQLRARGNRVPESTDLTADEIIAGSFRNISATVISVDPSADTLTVTDLATKKPVVIHVTADSQMHKLPAAMAQGLANRLKNPNSAASGNGQSPAATAPASENGAQSGPRQGNGQRNGDLSQILQRAPGFQISELHKGDAVMIVATQGTPDAATAITLLAGVEPILTASPSASQSLFSASWNPGGGGPAGADAGTP